MKTMKMSVFLFCLILVAMDYSPSSAHMVPDSSLSTNELQVSNPLGQSLDAQAPPVVIVELPKPKKNKRKKQKKNKYTRKRPPPANCVALGAICKSNSVCCDFCAFCQCRLFRTVCFCRMGNPRC
ncbi:unnamed protein product [Knipowitschia caucasica]|uniref:Agouti-signaling protein n=1 Tax=Knipowitschia caucasica TaxID=637954 RepID=A0AAV2M378_KNICA